MANVRIEVMKVETDVEFTIVYPFGGYSTGSLNAVTDEELGKIVRAALLAEVKQTVKK